MAKNKKIKEKSNDVVDSKVSDVPIIEEKKTGHPSVIPPSLVSMYVDEALYCHRNRDLINMFDCVNSLCYVLKSYRTGSDMNVLIQRLDSLRKGVSIEDSNGNIVEVPGYTIMDLAANLPGYHGDYMFDVLANSDDDKNEFKHVYLYMRSIYSTNEYIGRVLMIALFEILQRNDWSVPEEIYAVRSYTKE